MMEPLPKAFSEVAYEGCEELGVPESEHQLPFLTHRSGIGIEIHKILPGVRLKGGRSVSADELLEKGLVVQAPVLGPGGYLPKDEVMLAHILAHGIAQHGVAPGDYPMSRLLADVQDVGLDNGLWELAGQWIESDVSREEFAAVVGLVRRFADGEDPAVLVKLEDRTGAMLRHVLAGVLSEDYLRSMKFSALTAIPKNMGIARSLAKTIRGAVFPTDAQIDILYGKPRTSVGYWGWRLWRPFDLVLRSVKYGSAWVGHRLRKR